MNIDRLFFFNHSLTNSYNFIILFAPPPTPGTEPFQTIPHPWARRAGLVPVGMVTGQIEPCITMVGGGGALKGSLGRGVPLKPLKPELV